MIDVGLADQYGLDGLHLALIFGLAVFFVIILWQEYRHHAMVRLLKSFERVLDLVANNRIKIHRDGAGIYRLSLIRQTENDVV